MSYDLLDRLMGVTDEQGNAYEYTYDVENHMTKMSHRCGTSALVTSYTYDKDGRELTTAAGGFVRTTAYDKFGRVASQGWGTETPVSVSYEYGQVSTEKQCALPGILHANGTDLLYSYDANGNIISILETEGTSEILRSYEYDELNQLIRENDKAQGKTFVYSYDQGGNLQSVKEYAFTETTLPETPVKTVTGTYDATWKDKLLNWDGTAMTYEAIGNMLTKGSTTFSWQGRKLMGVENGKSIQYFYDHTGARTKKVVDGVATEYRMAGDLLVSEKTDGQTYWYRYDSNANLVSVTIKGDLYLYIKNLQGDIIALADETGAVVVRYTYDSWGRVLSITGSLADTIGVQNPFRYRGYYYDNETGMYYLKNRYYDPELRRFISADGVFTVRASLETLHNRNLYHYCNNNPVIRIDKTGDMWIAAAIGFVVGGVVSVGYQMLVEKKKIDEVNWGQAISAGLGTSMSLMGARLSVQIVASTIGDFVSSRLDGECLEHSIVNAAIGGITTGILGGFVDKDGLDYLKYTRKYKHTILKNIKDTNPVNITMHLAREEKKYYKNMVRVTTANISSTGVSYALTGVASSKCKHWLCKKIGWGYSYDPKTGYRDTYVYYSCM